MLFVCFIKEKNKADIAVMAPPLGMSLSAEERASLTNVKHLAVKAGKILSTSAGEVIKNGSILNDSHYIE